MKKNTTTYRPRLSAAAGGLFALVIIFFGLTLPLIIDGAPVEQSKLLALGGFWLMGIVLTVFPLGIKLEVGDEFVRSYLFGIAVLTIRTLDVQSVVSGWDGYGGIVLTCRTIRNGKNKAYKIFEWTCGEVGITHAKRVLEPQKQQVGVSGNASSTA